MAWDEWEQLKTQAADQSTQMQLNQLEPGGNAPPLPSRYGDLTVTQGDLAKIGEHAFTLYNDLWDRGRKALPSSDKAAGDLSTQGFALGGGLKHVATRWDEQLASLRDACAHISNHMRVTKSLHADNDHYIQRQMSSIDTLDQGFDERVGAPGDKNPVYGDADDKKDK
ncbi:hypothetical protein [Streptomyces minutiscleroticus]|uniref:AG1 protein n=1 Tax=Streptomyces minutiscleroticus TaxID=68238 RepID=A0A918U6L2_9ACTN|nr:hypothetical protein [Streptomyces minutiscleroticus]GGY01744.1 hypothetical protein GCM10010358_64660 [Streptomyces minutiscleroticus]